MPSLFSIPQGDPCETTKTKQSESDIITIGTEMEIEVTSVGESQHDGKNAQPSIPSIATTSDAVQSSTEEPFERNFDVKDQEKAERSSTSLSTPNSKKRRVSPNDDSGSKQKQQKKVNQMTLSSFFFQKSKNATPSSTSPKKRNQSKVTVQLDEVDASTQSSRKVASTKNDSSSITTLEKDTSEGTLIEGHEIIDLVSETDKLQAGSTATVLNSTDGLLTVEKEPLSKDEKEAVVKTKPSSEVEVDNDSADSSKKFTVSQKLKPNSKAPTETTNVLPASAVKKKKKTASGPSRSASTTSPTPKSNTKARRTSATKDSQSASTKKEKSLESPDTITAKKKLSEADLSEESCVLLQKYRTTKERYLERAQDVTQKHKGGLAEEDLGKVELQPIADATELKTNDANHCEEFPTPVMANMALLIEGSNLPLSSLVSKICSALNAFHKIDWSAESVSAKIKLLSKRRAYFEPTQKCDDTVDLFEHDCQDRLWRWEVTTLDLLNSDVASLARKARTARKKISSYQSALLKLVKSLDEIERQILDPALPNLDKSKAKISRDEERVLKFERDAEKQRLAEQSKARKLMEQAAKKKAREKAKEEAIEAKRRKKEELAEKKQEAAQAREEEKRKKEEEKLQKEQEKKKLEKKKLETAFRQKSTFRSFFAVPKKEENEPKTTSNTCTDGSHESFDVESFRSKVNASTDVVCFSMREQKRSDSAKASRRRRTEMVAVSVYKTVTADDADWGTPEYLEQTTIKVPNRYRFLSFHEDCRPAYRGTWMKKSSIVTGKNPFRKDTSVFDYDYDSEAEWEEGDDEMGEDVEDDAKNQEEEKDGEVNAKMYDFDDGFCVADDRLLDNEEDADDDTKALYKKKMLNREHEEHMHSNRIRIIAPGYGGLPLNLVESGSLNTDCVEGFDADDVADVLSSYKGIQLSDPKFCIDAFPQIRVNEEKSTEPSTNANANKDDYPAEAMIALARFSHHSTHNSKDKLIEELRTLHPTLFSIRAKATRKLDAIAVKRKHPKYSAVYWEVKTEVLTELGLTDIMEKKVEDIVYDSAVVEKVIPTSEEQKSKKSPTGENDSTTPAKKKSKAKEKKTKGPGSASKKRKPAANNKTSPGSASKKRKPAANNKNTEQKQSAKKTAKGEESEASRGKVKKESPKKKEDPNAGMKSLMAQFVKRSPVKTAPSASKDANASSSSQ